ncbi:hypothetical protein ACQKIE_00225 [Luteibacter sp. NPDC031894]|uniref:hypothetical protein n=1 Tax=Luteibacter sp. NPDC031894 TaxID=3390572 RepID=UPI003D0862AC
MNVLPRGSVSSLRGGLAIIVVTMFVVTLTMLFSHEVPDKSREMVSMFVGAQIGYVKDILSYYFPSLNSARTTTKAAEQ